MLRKLFLLAAVLCISFSAFSADDHVWNEEDGHVMEFVVNYTVGFYEVMYACSFIEDAEGANEFGLSLLYLTTDVVPDSEMAEYIAEYHNQNYSEQVTAKDITSVYNRRVIERTKSENWKDQYYVVYTAESFGNYTIVEHNKDQKSRTDDLWLKINNIQ